MNIAMTSSLIRHLGISGLLLVASAAYPESAGNVTQARVIAESGKGENWFLNGGNFRGEHFSPLTQINDQTVQNLGLAWSLDSAAKRRRIAVAQPSAAAAKLHCGPRS